MSVRQSGKYNKAARQRRQDSQLPFNLGHKSTDLASPSAALRQNRAPSKSDSTRSSKQSAQSKPEGSSSKRRFAQLEAEVDALGPSKKKAYPSKASDIFEFPPGMLKQPVPVFIPKPKLIIQKRKTPAAESKSLAPMPRISPLIEDDKEKHVQCPYCHADLTSDDAPVLPNAVQEALDAIRAADAAHAARRAQMIREGKFVDARDKDRKVHPHAKFRFCQLHTLELETKPLAAKHGYPVVLDRDALAASVRKSEKDLKAIIDRELDSQFREKAEQLYTQMSVHKVRNQESVMARFHEYLPGYYGPQGAEVIMNELQSMFLTKPVYLTKEKAHPQLPSEYVQQVLVPEAAARAIQRDRGISYDRAVATMHDTQDMGSKLFPIIESDNDASDAEDDANRDENDTDHDQDDESD